VIEGRIHKTGHHIKDMTEMVLNRHEKFLFVLRACMDVEQVQWATQV